MKDFSPPLADLNDEESGAWGGSRTGSGPVMARVCGGSDTNLTPFGTNSEMNYDINISLNQC